MLSLHLTAAPDRFAHPLCRNIDEAGRYLYLPTYPDHAAHLRAEGPVGVGCFPRVHGGGDILGRVRNEHFVLWPALWVEGREAR